MGIIKVKGIKVYAYHGCLEEEALIGSNYEVDVKIECDFTAACQTDELVNTVDYVDVYNIVREQMAIRSKLIEHAASRICRSLRDNIPAIQKVSVTVCKLNPPMNGDVSRVCVTV